MWNIILVMLLLSVSFLTSARFLKENEISNLLDQFEDVEEIKREIHAKVNKREKGNDNPIKDENSIDEGVDMVTDVLEPLLKENEKRGLQTSPKWDVRRDGSGLLQIPYTLDGDTLSAAAMIEITNAIKYINGLTCSTGPKWVPYSDEDYHVEFRNTPNWGCSSFIGYMKGYSMSDGPIDPQPINIGNGCEYKGIISHEMLHCMGFKHEQSRPDRDEYVTINWENIREGRERNFQKMSESVWDNSYSSPYDYDSVMHYGSTAFSTNGWPTIVAKKSGVSIGQRNGLSPEDIRQLNLFYGCPDSSIPSTTKPAPATTQAPPTTTGAPPATTELPPATTEAPPATTEAPPATTELPPATTEAPPATTGAPPATTELPPATTEAPPATTEAPPATTGAPPATTGSPLATTQALPATTQAPLATTQAPPATTKATPATTKATPATTKATPAITKATPAITKATPATTKATPATTKATPATTKATPATTKATPATTKKFAGAVVVSCDFSRECIVGNIRKDLAWINRGGYIAVKQRNRRRLSKLVSATVRAPDECKSPINYCVKLTYRRVHTSDQLFVVFAESYARRRRRTESEHLELPEDVMNTWTTQNFLFKFDCSRAKFYFATMGTGIEIDEIVITRGGTCENALHSDLKSSRQKWERKELDEALSKDVSDDAEEVSEDAGTFVKNGKYVAL